MRRIEWGRSGVPTGQCDRAGRGKIGKGWAIGARDIIFDTFGDKSTEIGHQRIIVRV